MQVDETENLRRAEMARLAAEAGERNELEERYGQVWNSDELRKEFEVLQFMAPFVVARRRSDGKMGSLSFQCTPRLYFSWVEDTP